MSAVRITKAAILNAISEGCTKTKKSPEYNPEVGTLHEKFGVTVGAMKSLFESNADLRSAYRAKFYKVNGKATEIILLDEEETTEEVQDVAEDTVEEVENDFDTEEVQEEDTNDAWY